MKSSIRSIMAATLLVAAVAAASSKAPEQAKPNKIVHAPVKMPAGSALEALDLVGEARRLRVYTQLRGIDDPGDAKLLFPANVKSQLGLTDQQANLLFHTGIRQSNRFETFDDSDTKVRDGFAELHPVGRFGTPEEIANAILFLSAPGNGFLTGHDLLVDGGYSAK